MLSVFHQSKGTFVPFWVTVSTSWVPTAAVWRHSPEMDLGWKGMKWKFSAVEHSADLVLLVQLQVELGKGSWKSSYSYSQCPCILVCYSEYWKWYTRRKKDQIGPQQKRAKSSWCKEWVMVKHWKQRLWVVNFIEKVDCKLQGYHKKRLKVRGCYIFSMYLIWGRFSNVEMFLAPLLKMCIWGKSVIFGFFFFFFEWQVSAVAVCAIAVL